MANGLYSDVVAGFRALHGERNGAPDSLKPHLFRNVSLNYAAAVPPADAGGIEEKPPVRIAELQVDAAKVLGGRLYAYGTPLGPSANRMPEHRAWYALGDAQAESLCEGVWEMVAQNREMIHEARSEPEGAEPPAVHGPGGI